MTTTWCYQPAHTIEAGDVIRFKENGREQARKVYAVRSARHHQEVTRVQLSSRALWFAWEQDVEIKAWF